MRSAVITLAVAVTAVTALAACGGEDAPAADGAAVSAAAAPGIRVVPPTEAAATIADPPDGLVILDVRTPEEYADGHIDGAVLLDAQRPDFADELARLERDVPYVLYCRSGNRSERARTLMDELGFASVRDIDGGILAWQDAGLPIVAAG